MADSGNTSVAGRQSRHIVPLMDGVARHEVRVDADGTHHGPPRYRPSEKTYQGNAGMTHHFLRMYCPCGHFIRYVNEYGKKERVTCEGALP